MQRYALGVGAVISRTSSLQGVLSDYIESALRQTASDSFNRERKKWTAPASVLGAMEQDLWAYAERDPASRDNPLLVLSSSASVNAVLHHRIIHALKRHYDDAPQSLTHALAKRGRELSGVEIHPAASIGARFVIDHGYGSVIGETAQIGDDCYFLGGVAIGARGIAGNRPGKRHPTIGNRVEIGAFARVLGPITVGDDVFIAPHAVITQDIPARSRVRIVNQVQIETYTEGHAPALAANVTGYRLGRDTVTLFGAFPPANDVYYADHQLCCTENALIVSASQQSIEVRRPGQGVSGSPPRYLVVCADRYRLAINIDIISRDAQCA